MERILKIVIAGMFLLIAKENPVNAAEVKNLLKNASFQEAVNPGFPDYWGGQSGWRQGTHTISKDVFVRGTKSMLLDNRDGRETVLFTANHGWSPGRAGLSYTFSVYLKAEPAGLTALLGSDRLEMKKVEVGGKWQRYSVTAPLNAVSGLASGSMAVTVALPANSKGRLWVNAPELIRTPAAAASSGEAGKEQASDLPSMKIPVISTLPSLDGELNDPCWKEAAVIKQFVVTSGSETPELPLNNTEVYLARTDRELCIGAKCFDSDMKNLSRKDWFEVFMGDENLLVYYHFWLHPSGQTSQDGTPGVFQLQPWAPRWHGRVSLKADRWEAEIVIPFFNMFPDLMSGDVWRFNVCREKYSLPVEISQWSNTRGPFHNPQRFGFLSGMKGANFAPPADIMSADVPSAEKKVQVFPDYMILDRSYYTTEETASVKIHLSAGTMEKAAEELHAALELKNGEGKPVYSKQETLAGSDTVFSFSLKELPDGGYTAGVTVTSGGKKIAGFMQELKKLPHFPGEVKINRFTRLLLVDGKPFIPLIAEVMFWGRKLPDRYADVPDDCLRVMADESGFRTLILWYVFSKQNMDDCANAGFKVIPFNYFTPFQAMQKGGQEAATEELVRMFNEYRSYPCLLAWFLGDEGNILADEKYFAERFRRLKQVDPYHPIFKNEGGWIPGFGGAGGLDATDIFCGGYGDYRLVDSINADAIPRGAPSLPLTGWFGPKLPTPAETVNWVYQILIHGACGGMFWGMHAGKPPVTALWDTMRILQGEVDVLTPVLNTVEPGAGIVSNNPNIHFTHRVYDGKNYLLCVNVGRKRETVVFSCPGTLFSGRKSAEVLFEKNKRAVIFRSRLTGKFGPLERRVYCW